MRLNDWNLRRLATLAAAGVLVLQFGGCGVEALLDQVTQILNSSGGLSGADFSGLFGGGVGVGP